MALFLDVAHSSALLIALSAMALFDCSHLFFTSSGIAAISLHAPAMSVLAAFEIACPMRETTPAIALNDADTRSATSAAVSLSPYMYDTTVAID